MWQVVAVAVIVLTIFVGMDSYFIYTQLTSDNPINVSKSKAIVLSGDVAGPLPTYSQSSPLHLQLTGCSSRDVTGILRASYVNTDQDKEIQIIPIATLGTTNKKGCSTGEVTLRLPSQVTPGNWLINFTEDIDSSKQVVNLNTNPFKVVEAQ